MSTSYNFELRCGASYIIKQRVSFVTVLATRSVALEVEHVLKVTRPSFFGGVPSYFEAVWYPHL